MEPALWRKTKNAVRTLFTSKYFGVFLRLGVLKDYLTNGVYVFGKTVFDGNARGDSSFVLEKSARLKFPFLIVCSKAEKKAQFDRAKIHLRGNGKTVVCFEDRVVAFYTIIRFEEFAQRMKQLIEQCNYPKSAFFRFDCKKRYVVYEYVDGTPLGELDVNKQIEIIKEFLLLNASAPICEVENEAYKAVCSKGYVQHGDMSKNHIFYEDGRFRMIDFDTIGIYPPLYDFHWLLLSFTDADLFQMYIDGTFDTELEAVLSRFGDHVSKETKDRFLSIYVQTAPNAEIRKWMKEESFRFLPETYVMTRQAIKEIIGDVQQ